MLQINEFKWLASKNPGIRLTDPEVDRIAGDYEELTGTTEVMDFRKFFWNVYDIAISRLHKTKTNQEPAQFEIQYKELKTLCEHLEQKALDLEAINSQLVKDSAELSKIREHFDAYLFVATKVSGGRVKDLLSLFTWMKDVLIHLTGGKFAITPAQIEAYKAAQNG